MHMLQVNYIQSRSIHESGAALSQIFNPLSQVKRPSWHPNAKRMFAYTMAKSLAVCVPITCM